MEQLELFPEEPIFPLLFKRSTDFVTDPNVLSLIKEFEQRSIKGEQKYGCTTDRDDIDLHGWLQHLKEELMDAAVYIKAAQRKMKPLTEAQIMGLFNNPGIALWLSAKECFAVTRMIEAAHGIGGDKDVR